jgi:hypothetical protein
MKQTAHLDLVPRLNMSETQLTLNVPYGHARRQPYFYMGNTGGKHQYCSTASTCLVSVVDSLGTDTNIAVQYIALYCQYRTIIIYCQDRMLTPWSSTYWTLTVAQLVKSIPKQTQASHPPPLLLEDECLLYTFTSAQVLQMVTSPKHCSTKTSYEHFTAPLAHSKHKTVLANFILTLILLTTTIVAPPSNACKWQMGFNSAFIGLSQIMLIFLHQSR